MFILDARHCKSSTTGDKPLDVVAQRRWRYIVSVAMAVYCVSGDGGILCQW